MSYKIRLYQPTRNGRSDLRNTKLKLKVGWTEGWCLSTYHSVQSYFCSLQWAGLKATDKIALSKLSGRQRKDNLVRKINQLPEEKIDQLRDLVNKLIGE